MVKGNPNYRKGRRKESSICDKLKKEGFKIAQRSTGSHSPIDVFAIDRENRIIKFIQSKRVLGETMDFIDEKQKKKIEKEFSWLNGLFSVEFVVM